MQVDERGSLEGILRGAGIPKGLPSYRPSLKTAAHSILMPGRYFSVAKTEGPFSSGDLAAHVARCTLLTIYRRLVYLILLLVPTLLLFLTHNTVPRDFSLDYLGHDTRLALLLFYPVIAATIFFWPLVLRVVDLLRRWWNVSTWPEPVGRYWLPSFAIRKFELYKTPVVFAFGVLSLAIMLWLYHISYDVQFHVAYSPDRPNRLLSGGEFLYFFLITYTTVGFGDISPVTAGGRFIVIIINLATLISGIYWFTALGEGIKQRRLVDDLRDLHSWNVERLERYRQWFEAIEAVRGHINCPDRRRRLTWKRSVCEGKSLTAATALSFVVWPPIFALGPIARAAGVSFWRLVEAMVGRGYIIHKKPIGIGKIGRMDEHYFLCYAYSIEPTVDRRLVIERACSELLAEKAHYPWCPLFAEEQVRLAGESTQIDSQKP